MFNSILVVCLGNICRSPTAEFMLQNQLPDKKISSAGLVACRHSDGSGWDMDANSRATAKKNGLECPPHEARQLSSDSLKQSQLVLVMDNNQRNIIAAKYPEAASKIFLLGHWLTEGSKDIPDPYQLSDEVFQQVYEKISAAVEAWVKKLV